MRHLSTFVFLAAGAAWAAGLGASWKNRSYLLERQPGDSLTALFYENLTLSAEGLTGAHLDFYADLSFQNRWHRDLALGEKKTDANVVYLQATPTSGLTLRAGRMAQARGFGFYFFDGGAAGWAGSRFSADVWGGLLRPGPENPDYVGEWQSGGLAAFNAGYRWGQTLKVQAGVLHRQVSNDSAGDFLDAGYWVRMGEGGSSSGLIETDLGAARPTRINVNALYPAASAVTVTAIVNAQLLERDSLSAFERLRLSPYVDGGAEGSYAFGGGRSAGAGLMVGRSDGDTRLGYILTAGGYGASLRAEIHNGYGINQDLLSGSYTRVILPGIKAGLRASYQKYRLLNDTEDRQAMVVAPKVSWRSAGGMASAGLEYQFVSNKYFDNDHRVLVETRFGLEKFYKSE